MPPVSRKLAFVVLVGAALLASGCGSNNKGKIEGKWKIVSLPEKASQGQSEFNELTKMGVYLFIDFQANGELTIGLGSEKPEVMEFIKSMAPPGQKLSWPAKYKLQSGDNVDIFDLPAELQKQGGGGMFGSKDKGRVKITIDGDNMTMVDEEGTGKLVRVK